MSIEVKLPDLGDGIESGDILEVLVQPGDQIAKDQGIVEIETDKATVEVPSPQPGKVAEVFVRAGQTVAVGQALITLESAAAPAEASASPPASGVAEPSPTVAGDPAEPAPAAESSATPSETVSLRPAAAPPTVDSPPEPRPAATGSVAPPSPGQPTPAAVPSGPAPAPPPAPSTAGAPTANELVAAGPAVRRFAREVGIDLSQVEGTGPGGRITREDVLQQVRQASRAAGSEPVTRPGPPDDQGAARPGKPSTDAWGPISVEPLTRIRKTIAAKMHQSWSTVPRVTNFDDADVTELEKIRQSSKADYADAGIKLTSMPFVVKAVALALRNHPVINASLDLDNNQIVYKRYFHIGIAVDTERGLVVPALRHADRLSIADTAKGLATLAQKARENSFTIEDLRGSTFSISNLGAIGGTYSTPVVNVPEVAILLVGRSRKLPVVRDDQVVVRLMMPLSLSYDHRLVDGAAAARFLNEVVGYLQAPGRLLLAP
jgi:pyruvate/2-oxoglutarate dehydrogenase complex dihydrolipoamide acyltransferase (E2) component